MSSRHLFGLLASACALSLMAAGPAGACSLVSFADNGRYVGGDLASQISARADTIQIVRVSAKHLVRRTYTAGEWYLDFGDHDVPDHLPPFIDEFVFELSVIETLKNETPAGGIVYENSPRILGYGGPAPETSGDRPPAGTGQAQHPNRLPAWLVDRPGDGGHAFIGAAEGAGLGGGECASPYLLDVGQTLVALRDSSGRLYPASGAFPLKIDVEFATGQRRSQRLSLNMQSLVPISGPDDPFLGRLRAALAH